MQQLLHVHNAEIKTTFDNETCATINAKAEPVESMNIRGSLHVNTQINSSSTLSLLLVSFSWQREPLLCLKMPAVTVYCSQRASLRGDSHVVKKRA